MVRQKEGAVKRVRIVSLCLGVALALMLAGIVWAGSAPDTKLDWRLLSGGGAPAAGAGLALNASLGQTAIGASSSGDSGYALGAGFWYGAEGGGWAYRAYLPVTMREY
jgi:hypothetical protein